MQNPYLKPSYEQGLILNAHLCDLYSTVEHEISFQTKLHASSPTSTLNIRGFRKFDAFTSRFSEIADLFFMKIRLVLCGKPLTNRIKEQTDTLQYEIGMLL